MPTHKVDLGALSITQLSDLTGVSEKTIRSRLMEKGVRTVREDGRTLWYAPRQALPAIFKLGDSNPFAEKARLDAARADMTELDLAERRGELLPVADVEFALAALLSGARTRILAVPAKVAAEIAAETSPAACHALIERAIHEALEQIANVSVAHLSPRSETPGNRPPDSERSGGAQASAEAHGR